MKIVGEIAHVRLKQIGVGEGMNSRVFHALDPQLGGEFAMKVIDKFTFGADINRYFEEAQAMFATAHANIVPIQYACQTDTEIMLAMPYFSQGSLSPRIANGPISPRELIRIALGILDGLSQIHNAGYIHFDLKPSNIMFSNTEDPLVADFGQARKVLLGGGVIVPRMYYRAMPPETLSSGAGSILGDIYQVGLLLYRAVNGDPWHQAQFVGLDDATMEQRVIAGKLPNRKAFLPHVPQRIRKIIRKALKPDSSERFPSAREFAVTIARVDPALNWETAIYPSGEMSWIAERPGKTKIEVNLLKSCGSWVVRVWTVNGTKRRAMGSSAMNKSGLNENAAMLHLNDVFSQLS